MPTEMVPVLKFFIFTIVTTYPQYNTEISNIFGSISSKRGAHHNTILQFRLASAYL